MKEPILLPAGKVRNREDLNRQLGFDDDRWPVPLVALMAAGFVFLIACAAIGAIAFGIYYFK